MAKLFKILVHLNLKVTNRRGSPAVFVLSHQEVIEAPPSSTALCAQPLGKRPSPRGQVPGAQVECTAVSDLVLHAYLTFQQELFTGREGEYVSRPTAVSFEIQHDFSLFLELVKKSESKSIEMPKPAAILLILVTLG